MRGSSRRAKGLRVFRITSLALRVNANAPSYGLNSANMSPLQLYIAEVTRFLFPLGGVDSWGFLVLMLLGLVRSKYNVWGRSLQGVLIPICRSCPPRKSAERKRKRRLKTLPRGVPAPLIGSALWVVFHITACTGVYISWALAGLVAFLQIALLYIVARW